MPLFHFHFFNGSEYEWDEDGFDLPDVERAYIEAFRGAKAIWLELLDDRRDPRPCRLRVDDPTGKELFELSLAELVDEYRSFPPHRPNADIPLDRLLANTHQRASMAGAKIAESIAVARNSLQQSRDLLDAIDRLTPRRSRPAERPTDVQERSTSPR